LEINEGSNSKSSGAEGIGSAEFWPSFESAEPTLAADPRSRRCVLEETSM